MFEIEAFFSKPVPYVPSIPVPTEGLWGQCETLMKPGLTSMASFGVRYEIPRGFWGPLGFHLCVTPPTRPVWKESCRGVIRSFSFLKSALSPG